MVDDLWATKSEDVGLTVRTISFQDFQPVWSWSTNITDGQTDDMWSQDRALHYIVVHKKWDTFIFFDNSGKYWRIFVIFFTTTSSKELRNKNLLKFSPHLKYVATLPCKTWNAPERLLRERPTFSTSVMVSVAVSKLRCTELFLCNLEWKWMATIIAKYCWRRSCCMHQGNIGWQFHIPTGQHTSAQGSWHNRTFMPRDARLHFSRPVASEQTRYEPHGL